MALVFAATGAGCGEQETTPVADAELLGLEADQVMIDVDHIMTRDGVRRAHLLADTAWFLPDESRIRLRNLEVTFFGEGATETSVLEARGGVYDTRSGDMSAEGDVEIDDRAGRRLETSRIRYDAGADRIYGDTAFVFTRGTTVTRGESFDTDPAMTDVRLERPEVVSPDVAAP